jgi:hypothetical protein
VIWLMSDKVCMFQCVGTRQARLVRTETDPRSLAADEIEGATICSLVSPGTELAMWVQSHEKPWVPGYAAVLQAAACGEAVNDVRPGDRRRCPRHPEPGGRPALYLDKHLSHHISALRPPANADASLRALAATLAR